MSVCGIDYSTHAVDVVLLDEDTDAATWHRFELVGHDAFERARSVRTHFVSAAHSIWDDVMAVGIEDPRGYGAGSMYRIQGAVLSCVPARLLVQPLIPSSWRKTVGLPGGCDKGAVNEWALKKLADATGTVYLSWPLDATDAYAIAYATRSLLEMGAAA